MKMPGRKQTVLIVTRSAVMIPTSAGGACFIQTMKKTFLFRSTGFEGVCIFNFDGNAEDAA